MDEEHKKLLDEVNKHIEFMQSFDSESIARKDLGLQLNFEEVVPVVQRLVNLYRCLSLATVEELTVSQIEKIKHHTLGIRKYISGIMNFNLSNISGNPMEQRRNIIRILRQMHSRAFEDFLICYDAIRKINPQSFDNIISVTKENIEEEIKKLKKEIESFQNEMTDLKKEGEDVLNSIRNTAAEHGVSQQATFFKEEADGHEVRADKWRNGVWITAGSLVAFAMFSLFLPTFYWLENVGTVQLTISKTLIFSALAYSLFFCAKNYAAHRHNVVINRHRQNALMTYQALVKANSNPENADIVLAQAARYIYAPQDTGHTRGRAVDNGSIAIESFRRFVDKQEKG